MELKVPTEIFDLILDIIKSTKYNITTLKLLAITCQHLNLVLHNDILNKQSMYNEPYIDLGFTMTPREFHISELVFDGLLDDADSLYDASMILVTKYGLSELPSTCITLCYAAILSNNMELLQKISLTYLKNVMMNVGKCVGYVGNNKMLIYFKKYCVTDAFLRGCVLGAFVSDNINTLEYCHMFGMQWAIRDGMTMIMPIGSERCCLWVFNNGYLE